MTDLQACLYRNALWGTFPAAQRLGLCALSTEGSGLLSGQGAEIPQATGRGQKKKRYSLRQLELRERKDIGQRMEGRKNNGLKKKLVGADYQLLT